MNNTKIVPFTLKCSDLLNSLKSVYEITAIDEIMQIIICDTSVSVLGDDILFLACLLDTFEIPLKDITIKLDFYHMLENGYLFTGRFDIL